MPRWALLTSSSWMGGTSLKGPSSSTLYPVGAVVVMAGHTHNRTDHTAGVRPTVPPISVRRGPVSMGVAVMGAAGLRRGGNPVAVTRIVPVALVPGTFVPTAVEHAIMTGYATLARHT